MSARPAGGPPDAGSEPGGTMSVTDRLDERALALDGATLRYVVEGPAGAPGEPALAFAHGWCSKLEHWDAQAAAFRGSHRVVRWDRRGMGRSTTAAPADS